MTDQVPPNSEEAEFSTLGAAMLIGGATNALVAVVGLKPEHFYRPRHQTIYRAILDLHGRDEPIDVVTVCAELTRRGELEHAGGEDYVHELPARSPAIGSFVRHGELVREDARFRAEISAARDLVQAAFERNRDRIADARGRLEAAADVGVLGRLTIDQRQEAMWAHIEGDEAETFRWPFGPLNDMFHGGMRRKNMTIVGAWRSHGKSVLVPQTLELNQAHGHKVALYTNEDSAMTIDLRYASRDANIPFGRIIRGGKHALHSEDEQRRYHKAIQALSIEVIEAHGWTAEEYALDIRAHGWDLVGIDLLNKIPAKDTQEIDRNVALLSATAARADCHIIGTQHFNEFRNTGTYPPKPAERDIRGSGAIANYGDNVVLVYRWPEDTGETDADGNAIKSRGNRTSIEVTKCKGGVPGETEVRFNGNRMKFEDPPAPGTVGAVA